VARIAPRHGRFLLAFAFGLVVGVGAWVQDITPVNSALTGVNGFFLLYLVLMVGLIRQSGPAELRAHAAQDDEGVALILALAVLAIAVSVSAIVMVLTAPQSGFVTKLAAMATLPLGWAMVHTMAAFHYAHRYYRTADRGLVFPGKADPGAWDFMYFSFTIGMTAQVSDVAASNQAMRQTILLHALASFFYNTGILALAVNAVITASS
jgi:uncharacterized membrane protein